MPDDSVHQTIFIPIETYRELKQLAFTYDITKGELINQMIIECLARLRQEGHVSLAEKLTERKKKLAKS